MYGDLPYEIVFCHFKISTLPDLEWYRHFSSDFIDLIMKKLEAYYFELFELFPMLKTFIDDDNW